MPCPHTIKIPRLIRGELDALPGPVWTCLKNGLVDVRTGRRELKPHPFRQRLFYFRACEYLIALSWPSDNAAAVVVRVQRDIAWPV